MATATLNHFLANIMARSLNSGVVNTGPRGTQVPFYIFAGQSNTGNTPASGITGSATASYSESLAITNAYIYNPVYTGSTTFTSMSTGLNTIIANGFYPDTFGSEVSLMFNLNSASAGKRYMVKYGVGNTSLAVDWNSTTPGALYSGLLSAVDTAIGILVPSGSIPVLKAFIWMQGETDATDITQSNNYLSNLNNFFTNFKSHYAGKVTSYNLPTSSNNFLTIIGRINATFPSGTYPFRTTVRSAEVEYCSTSSNNAVFINTDGYDNNSSVHYVQSGQIQFGVDQFVDVNTYYSSSGSF